MSLKTEGLPTKHSDGRWMYDEKRLTRIFNKMSDKRKLSILLKAIGMLAENRISKWSAIARVLGCSYDDAGFWASRKQIRS